MEKNRLLLNKKKFLSFSNYKNILKNSNKTKKDVKLFLSTNFASPTLIIKQKSFKKIVKNNINNNVPILINGNSNKLFTKNKSLKIFSLNKNIPKLNISKNIYSIEENKLNTQYFKYVIKKRKDDINAQINDNIFRERNSNKKIINKRNRNFFKKRSIFNKTNFRYSMNCSEREKFYENENKKREEDGENYKSQNKCISSRKINKESFGNEIYKIIKERKGKKFKFKIIGTLKTEPNCCN